MKSKAIVGMEFVNIPMPSPFTPMPPPYPFEPRPDSSHPLYDRWYRMSIARYVKKAKKMGYLAKDMNEFHTMRSTVDKEIFDNRLWLLYAKINKRKALKALEVETIPKVKPLKRSDAMRVLLFEHDAIVGDDGYIVGYDQVRFLPNGRIQLPDENPISVHKFIQEYC